MSGQPAVNFAVHQVRAGQSGAGEDFEEMLGLLVRATSGGDARLVFANPGDWGIDVLAGDLNGRVSVWQAKYFTRGWAAVRWARSGHLSLLPCGLLPGMGTGRPVGAVHPREHG